MTTIPLNQLSFSTTQEEGSSENVVEFQTLPVELKLRVFSYLSPQELTGIAAKVCKNWWILSREPSLWESLTLNFSFGKKDPSFQTIAERCASLRRLRVETKLPVQLFRVFSGLKELNLSCCTLYTEDLETIAECCKEIERLTLEWCTFDQKCIYVITSLPKLHSINLTGCRTVDDSCIEVIARDCKFLRSFKLDLEFSRSITNEVINELLWNHRTSLRKLEISGEHWNLTEGVALAIGACSNLSTLRLHLGTTVSSLPSLANLKVLDLTGSTCISISKLFKRSRLSILEDLTIKRLPIDDDTLSDLAGNLKSLRKLRISCCSKLSNIGIRSVMWNCQSLYVLQLQHMPRLTGEIVDYIPVSLPNLRELTVEHCWTVKHCPHIENLAFNMRHLKLRLIERRQRSM